MSSVNIFCISAGQLDSKKKNSIFPRKHRYLNYGLLKIASILNEYNYHPIVIHGLFYKPADTLGICNQLGINDNDNPILLSIPSFFALEWAREFASQVKLLNPTKKIIVGGRWVIGSNEKWLKSYLNVDLVVPGLVGTEIVKIVNDLTQNKIKKMMSMKQEIHSVGTSINYRLLYERHLFQPSIEVSNGCGMGCSFCEERNISLSKLKLASVVAKEMEALVMDDDLIEITPYLESSMFVATENWANELRVERETRGLSSKWRVESRVDKLKVKNIPTLAKAGLKVIDLGLESASHVQLERMKKTDDPRKYLAAASELIQVAYDNGIWVKINILLYAGETSRSIEETVSWISNISNYLKGVSVGPVIVYGINDDSSHFVQEVGQYGASAMESEIKGVTYLNLSEEIDFYKSLDISKQISREFMTAKDFFDLKSFSYFARDYKYSDFLTDIEQVNQEEVSFKL
jgi:hypothetical protein